MTFGAEIGGQRISDLTDPDYDAFHRYSTLRNCQTSVKNNSLIKKIVNILLFILLYQIVTAKAKNNHFVLKINLLAKNLICVKIFRLGG